MTSSTFPNPLALTSVDGPPRLIDGAAMDYFLIELVSTIRESAAFATRRQKAIEAEMAEAGLVPSLPATTAASKPSARDSVTSLGSKKAGGAYYDEEEEPVRARLEAIGMHVGANFSERLCKDRSIFNETLDVIKFVCKDLWAALWDKQVDNLRTNHRGVYVLQDNTFKPISRLSSHLGRADAMKKARLYAALPAGIIRGVLMRLGFPLVTVAPEITSMPQCTRFNYNDDDADDVDEKFSRSLYTQGTFQVRLPKS